MKTLRYTFIFLTTLSLFLLTGCEEEETDSLLSEITKGQMILSINNEPNIVLEHCVSRNFGESVNSEVYIEGHLSAQNTMPYFIIALGSEQNTQPLAVRSYSTSIPNDMARVFSSYGNSDTGASVIVKIVSIESTGIKGTFNGKLQSEQGIVDVKGAFWSTQTQTPFP